MSIITLKNGKEMFSDLNPDEAYKRVKKTHKLRICEFKAVNIWQKVYLTEADIRDIDSYQEEVDKFKPQPTTPAAISNFYERRRKFGAKYRKKIKQDKFNTRLGHTIKNLREQRGLTIQHVAAVLNLKFRTVNSYEHGEIHIPDKRVEQIADIFKMDAADIREQAKKLKID